MTYTWTVLLGVLGAATLDLVLLRTRLLRRTAFWTAYAIVLFFQLIVNGLLTGLRVVRYDAVDDPRLAARVRAGRGSAVRLRDGAHDAEPVGVAGPARRAASEPRRPRSPVDARRGQPTRARRLNTS